MNNLLNAAEKHGFDQVFDEGLRTSPAQRQN
jgi:hypothetical protein